MVKGVTKMKIQKYEFDDFIDYMIEKGYDSVCRIVDFKYYYENLLTFKENEQNYLDWLKENK
jgi:hypothetical protein